MKHVKSQIKSTHMMIKIHTKHRLSLKVLGNSDISYYKMASVNFKIYIKTKLN